jgi:hypothetical protein
MANNFQPRAGAPTAPLGLVTAGDVALQGQQNTYFQMCNALVASVRKFNAKGQDITNQVQIALLNQQVPMTVAAAVGYQPTATSLDNRWSVGITDWLATYSAYQTFLQNYQP